LAGYALPRLFLEQLGNAKALPKREIQDRLVRGIDIFSKAAIVAHTPLELLAFTAEGVLRQGDVPQEVVLKQVFSKGWLAEHNAGSVMESFKNTAWEVAPRLYEAYEALSDEQRTQLNLA